MQTSSPLLIALLAALGLAVAGMFAMVLSERRHGRRSVLPATVWFLLVYLPLLAQFAWPGAVWSPVSSMLDAEPLDFGGAVPVFLSLSGAALAVEHVFRRQTVHAAIEWTVIPRARMLMVVVIVTVGWALWLMSVEHVLNDLSLTILVNTTLMSVCAVLGGSLPAIPARRIPLDPATLCASSSAGLAAATASAAFLEPGTAAIVGAVAGLLAGWLLRGGRRTDAKSLGRIVCVSGVAGVGAGLVAVGLLERSRGLLFTGQPGLLIAEVLLGLASLAYAYIVTMLLAQAYKRMR
ncbi:ammonium transporter family [Homoserinimonas aerilata]|uniref:Ammonium transporter family n=1 Tax=Homoserinimonas aerilata TaxID=1162970 RepID=A0A542YIM6_9MICO|nr:hypothetical protein [Homoserinimonas aerilata]TQL47939.1 ammonium transporter family [Homoserinimonas aerilata]